MPHSGYACGADLAKAETVHRDILARLRSINGDVYSEDMTILVQSGREVPAEPSSVTFLAAKHLWNEQPLVERLQNRRFAAVIVNSSIEDPEHFSPAVRQAVLSGY